MPPKKPRRTAERILETTLDLFNRFGEPNVSTTLISSELGISPGNLYYHYPAKDELINALLDRYEVALSEVLRSAREVSQIDGAWSFFLAQFDLMWNYRFLYRDLNDLLCRNRHFERRFGSMVAAKLDAVRSMLAGMRQSGALQIGDMESEPVTTSMVVVSTYWLSFEYVRDPRNALEPSRSEAALTRGSAHVLSLLLPYLDIGQRARLTRLAGSYSMPQVLDSQPAALTA
ncbi:TetR/AcrR family transcriptional regulator [soil metagenome]